MSCDRTGFVISSVAPRFGYANYWVRDTRQSLSSEPEPLMISMICRLSACFIVLNASPPAICVKAAVDRIIPGMANSFVPTVAWVVPALSLLSALTLPEAEAAGVESPASVPCASPS